MKLCGRFENIKIPDELQGQSYYWLNENRRWVYLHTEKEEIYIDINKRGRMFTIGCLRSHASYLNRKHRATDHRRFHCVGDIKKRPDLLLLLLLQAKI